MSIRKERLPKLHARAVFQPELVNVAERTAELVFTTEAPVLRGFWSQFNEVLSMRPEAVRMGRMNNGAPLLNTHKQRDLDDVIGVVEKAWLVGDEMRGIVRFPKAEDDIKADGYFRKVVDGIIRNASIGYVVNEYEAQEAPEGETPTWIAIDWEPCEISLVPVGADANAGSRSMENHDEPDETFEVKIRSKKSQEDRMDPVITPAPVAVPTPTPAVDVKAEREAATKAERTRSTEIRALVRKASLGDDLADQMITDGLSLDGARELVINKWAERGNTPAKPANPDVTIVREARDTTKEGIEEALLGRAGQLGGKALSENARRFGGLNLRELARMSLVAQNVDVTGMSPMELAGRALHTTSDFPQILANVINRTLRRAYEEGISSYADIVREVEVADFRTIARVAMGDAPQLEEVLEDGEIQRGTFGDTAESYKLKTYAKIIGVTRQVLVNDDMDALVRVPQSFGAAAKSLIADVVWNIINSNPLMADGFALFSAQHGNLVAGNASVAAGLPAMRQALKKQTNGAGRFLNLLPSKLIVPTERETEAEGVISPLILPQQASNVNAFARSLSIVSDPRLAALPYYLAASVGQIDIIELAFLQGQKGVYTEQRMGFEVDGLEIKARLDFAAKAIDWRGLVKNPGV